MKLDNILKNKSKLERRKIKGQEIVKIKSIPKTKAKNIEIEIVSFE